MHLKCSKKKNLCSLGIFRHKENFHYFLCQNTFYVFRSICFSFSEISLYASNNNAGHLVSRAILEDYVKDKVPSLKQFANKGNADQESHIPSLEALSSAMRLIIGC